MKGIGLIIKLLKWLSQVVACWVHYRAWIISRDVRYSDELSRFASSQAIPRGCQEQAEQLMENSTLLIEIPKLFMSKDRDPFASCEISLGAWRAGPSRSVCITWSPEMLYIPMRCLLSRTNPSRWREPVSPEQKASNHRFLLLRFPKTSGSHALKGWYRLGEVILFSPRKYSITDSGIFFCAGESLLFSLFLSLLPSLSSVQRIFDYFSRYVRRNISVFVGGIAGLKFWVPAHAARKCRLRPVRWASLGLSDTSDTTADRVASNKLGMTPSRTVSPPTRPLQELNPRSQLWFSHQRCRAKLRKALELFSIINVQCFRWLVLLIGHVILISWVHPQNTLVLHEVFIFSTSLLRLVPVYVACFEEGRAYVFMLYMRSYNSISGECTKVRNQFLHKILTPIKIKKWLSVIRKYLYKVLYEEKYPLHRGCCTG